MSNTKSRRNAIIDTGKSMRKMRGLIRCAEFKDHFDVKSYENGSTLENYLGTLKPGHILREVDLQKIIDRLDDINDVGLCMKDAIIIYDSLAGIVNLGTIAELEDSITSLVRVLDKRVFDSVLADYAIDTIYNFLGKVDDILLGKEEL